eukprot:2888576-Pyramimonas_sp.AAC.1
MSIGGAERVVNHEHVECVTNILCSSPRACSPTVASSSPWCRRLSLHSAPMITCAIRHGGEDVV